MGETKDMIKNLFGTKRAENPDNKGEGEEYYKHHPRSHSPDIITTKDRKRRRKHTAAVTAHDTDPNVPIPPMETTDWPPGHLKKDEAVDAMEAVAVIADGAPIFKGFRSAVPNVPGDHWAFYAIADEVPGDGYDAAKYFHPSLSLASFLFSGPGVASLPWQTLEQPSLAFSYGYRPGTITLNHWVGLFGYLDPLFEFVEPAIKLRNLELESILSRLRYLEGGFEEDYPDLMYNNLYGNSGVLKDPDRYLRPHKTIERQIADLITVLSRKDWIDFSNPKNWVVARFFRDVRIGDTEEGYHFFLQLLVSMELDVRICSKLNEDAVRQKLMAQLPAPIAYSVAVARRWREGVRIEAIEGTSESERIKLKFRLKKQQLKSVRKFARVLRWKNQDAIESALQHTDPEQPRVEERSSDALTYVSGVILPGPSFPWLLMNTLIDCDDEAEHELDLSHVHPHCGFQYKGSTYWSSTSIVGKVLAPTAQEVGGWIGPCLQSTDLQRTEVARLRQRRPGTRLEVNDIKSMEIRSDPLGPESRTYPLDEYELVLPDLETTGDSVKIEKLTFKKLSRNPRDGEEKDAKERKGPFVYDAGIQFAIDGQSWPLKLNFNTEYISAYPCTNGPHPLFYDYKYKAVNVASVLDIKDWGSSTALVHSPVKPSHNTSSSQSSSSSTNHDPEKVLVIEAFGTPDNEVLARAYCSHWRLSAVVADVSRTCMSCAIREAYAACVSVVILAREHLGKVED